MGKKQETQNKSKFAEFKEYAQVFTSGKRAAKLRKKVLQETSFDLLDEGLSAVGAGVVMPFIRTIKKVAEQEIGRKKALRDLAQTVFDAPRNKSKGRIIDSVADKTSAFICANALDESDATVSQILQTIAHSEHKGGEHSDTFTYNNLKIILASERISAEKEQIQEDSRQMKLDFSSAHDHAR